MKRTTDVLVVGAGPTGLTLATLLHKWGVACMLIDKASGPSTTSKALGLQYRASELLTWMGIADSFFARGIPQLCTHMYVNGTAIATLRMGSPESATRSAAFVPRAMFLPQSETEALLGAALRDVGGDVAWNSELTDVQQSANASHVEATLANGERIEARYLVSCEGAHSVGRRACNIKFEGKTYPHDFLMADVNLQNDWPHGEGHSWLHPDGVVATMPLPTPGRWRIFAEVGPEQSDNFDLDTVRRIFVERTGDRHTVIGEAHWLSRFKIHSRCVERFRAGRVFVAGDAAHLHSPAGGQGVVTGMQDSYNLAWKLRQVLQHGAPEALLDTYNEERRPAARQVLASTDTNNKVLFANTPLAKLLRNRVYMPLFRTQWMHRRLIRRVSQLEMHYRGASLSWNLRKRKRRAGDRAPDAVLSVEHGQPVTLFNLLRQGKPVVLLTQEQPRLQRAMQQLGCVSHVVDGNGDARQVYGVAKDDMWVIRPDGYIGLCCAQSDATALRDYLSKLCDATQVQAAMTAPQAQPASHAL